MFKHKSTKSVIFIVMAVLMVATVMLAACDYTPFQPVEAPAKATPEGNGGNAVKYGEWIYYVNGYQSSASETNTYEQVVARVGAIARIKVADLEKMFAVYDDPNLTSSTARTNAIAKIVEENAQIVVPKFYYSGNTTTTHINGIYIFNERLYILTPNDELTAGGNSQTNQSVLTSFKLDGSDEQRHYVFTNNAAQVLLSEIGGKLIATYIMGNEVGSVDVEAKAAIKSITEVSSAQLDVAGNAVFYLNSDGAICKYNGGAAEAKTIVANEKDSHITYTISNVNNGYVYYTKANSNDGSLDGKHVYYATETTTEEAIAWKGEAPSSNWYGYNQTIVYAMSESVEGTDIYGIYVLNANDGSGEDKQIINPANNPNSITFNRIVGSELYYTSNSIAYVVDLSKDEGPVALGRSLSSASGWSVPDILPIEGTNYNYVISLGTGSVSAYKFDRESKTNIPSNNSVTMTIVQPTEEE